MTTQTLESPAGDDHGRRPLALRLLHSFRLWRKERPFPAGLLIVLSGVELWLAPYSSIGVMIHEGIAGFSAVFIGALLVMFGLTVWFAPAYRAFAGIASILLGLIALPTVNIGGFVLGTLLALIGGALAVSWTPRPGWDAPGFAERRRRRNEQRALEATQSTQTQAAQEPAQAGEAGTPETTAAEAEGAPAVSATDAELAALEARVREPVDPTTELPEVEDGGAPQHPED